jgi:simple sugar transport system permease protein
MCVAGLVAGALYGLLPTILKVKLGTNETLFTLMLNYIALYVIVYLGVTKADWNIFLRADSVRPQFAFFPKDTWMGGIKIGSFTLSYSFLLTILIFVLVYIYLNKTKKGYETMVVGDSPNAARYAGMKVDKIVIRTMLLSASLVGLAGAFYASSSHSISESITGGVGWTGIIVAWLSKLNPVWIFITAMLMSILGYGSKVAATQFTNIDASFAGLLQGIILFLILVADFFIRFKIVIRSKDTEVAQ